MRKTKWIFFIYLAITGIIVIGMGVSLAFTPPRDPHTLYTIHPGTLKSLDPAEVNDVPGASLLGLIYECLYNYQFAATNPYKLIPELAAEMPVISPDNLQMTIRLRKGIHFYDPDKRVFPDGVGPEIKARNVIYSFKRVCDFNLASVNYSTVFDGKIAGIEKWWDYTKSVGEKNIDWDKPVDGFQIVDDYTIRLILQYPNPQMIFNLAASWTSVVSRDAVNYWTDDFRLHPIGSGPYFLREHLRDQRIIMEANPIYRGKPDADGDAVIPDAEKMPHIKRIEYDYFDESVPPWLLFTQGLFDVSAIPKESFDQAINVSTGSLTPDLEKKGIVLRKSDEAGTYYIAFNMQDPILGKNKPLRQAMSMAYDRETFIKNFLNGRGTSAISPIPPGFPTYDAAYVNPNTQFNLDAARGKMKEAEKINGGPIPTLQFLLGDTSTSSRQMAEYFSIQMKQIGLNIEPEFRDFARYLEMVDNRQTQLFDGGWVADYPDEQDFLQLFYGKNAPASGIDSCAYTNPVFDKLYDQAAVMQDTPQRKELYKKMEAILMDDCPWLTQFYPKAYALHYDWVQGGVYMDYGYGYPQFLKLDEVLRQQRLGRK